MEEWKKEILRNSMAQDIITDYHDLLSVGRSDFDAEDIIVSHYLDNTSLKDIDKGFLWVALAVKQWELGRLSTRVKENAMLWTKHTIPNISNETIEKLTQCLSSPLPPKKKISRPKWISKCPWPVGSLLAYRIISTNSEKVINGPYWKKYVLLRVIMIKRDPISWLSPECEWRESMIVGLYNWCGDSIPDPSIAEQLSFTPVSIQEPELKPNVLHFHSQELEQCIGPDNASFLTERLSTKRVETCVCLDWRCAKGVDQKKVFTYLGHDSKYQEVIPDFFKTDITQYTISHSIPFDVMLAQRFEQLTKACDDTSMWRYNH